jgi:hypothetical protein
LKGFTEKRDSGITLSGRKSVWNHPNIPLQIRFGVDRDVCNWNGVRAKNKINGNESQAWERIKDV